MINTKEASEILGVSEATVRNWAEVGTIPAYNYPGKLWKFKKSELEEWQESQKNQKA